MALKYPKGLQAEHVVGKGMGLVVQVTHPGTMVEQVVHVPFWKYVPFAQTQALAFTLKIKPDLGISQSKGSDVQF